MAAKYSEEYIAAVKAGTAELPADKGQATYVKRLARNYEPGISRSQQRGHARVAKGEKPISVVKQEKKATIAPASAQIQKPSLSKKGKAGRKNLGRQIIKQHDQAGNVRRTRYNYRSTGSVVKRLARVGNERSVIMHLITKDGSTIKAVGRGKKHTANAGDLKKRIADKLAAGVNLDDAFFDAVGESFDLYDEDGQPVAIETLSFTNVIMFVE